MAKVNETVGPVEAPYKLAKELIDESRTKGDDALERIYNGTLSHHSAQAAATIINGRVNVAVAAIKAGI